MIAFFTPTNQHVIYYNKGKRTIRVFRSIDGRQIADMKCPAKVRQACATHDGRALIVGYEDGVIQTFLIVDPYEPSTIAHLKHWRQQQFGAELEAMQQELAEKQPEQAAS